LGIPSSEKIRKWTKKIHFEMKQPHLFYNKKYVYANFCFIFIKVNLV
jgi:hypothetical protein